MNKCPCFENIIWEFFASFNRCLFVPSSFLYLNLSNFKSINQLSKPMWLTLSLFCILLSPLTNYLKKSNSAAASSKLQIWIMQFMWISRQIVWVFIFFFLLLEYALLPNTACKISGLTNYLIHGCTYYLINNILFILFLVLIYSFDRVCHNISWISFFFWWRDPSRLRELNKQQKVDLYYKSVCYLTNLVIPSKIILIMYVFMCSFQQSCLFKNYVTI